MPGRADRRDDHVRAERLRALRDYEAYAHLRTQLAAMLCCTPEALTVVLDLAANQAEAHECPAS